MAKALWASGPGEILRHGLALLQKDSDTSRRLAMLNIDNSVELTIKTYLGLPKRITGLNIPRNKYDEFSESFPRLLDALNEYAASKTTGIDLGEIEWLHRLRNQLYHEGNGLAPERDKVTLYAELAKVLFKNLFGEEIGVSESSDDLLGQFLMAWADLERLVYKQTAQTNVTPNVRRHFTWYVRLLHQKDIIDADALAAVHDLREIRGSIVHGSSDDRKAITTEMIRQVRAVTATLEAKRKHRAVSGGAASN